MKRKFVKAISLLMIAVISITQTGATELPDAEEAAPETPLETPIETVVEVSEETTELGLALADIPETMSAEQTVEAEHVARLREEELEPNTAVFRNSDGTNTLYIFSEEIWYENEDGEKVDYSTELEAAPETAEAAYRATGGGGELLLPGTVGENTPIEYSEGGLSISLYPTTERIVMPEPGSVGELQQKPAALAVVASEPERGDTAPPAPEPAAGESTAQPSEPAAGETPVQSEVEQSETEQSEAASSQSSESEVSQSSSQAATLSVSQSSSQASEGTVASGAAGTDTPSSAQNGAASSQASESAAESAGAAGEASYAEPENGSAGAAIDAGEATAAGIEEMTPSAAEYRPVQAKAIAGIGSAEEAQAIAMANAQASLAAGKAVNTASLVSANDAAVPDKQSVEYFRASRDASIVTTPLLHGVKNEIALSFYSGCNTCPFTIRQ